MTRELTLRRVGGSVAATLPKVMAERLRMAPGDRVMAIESESGILITPFNPAAEKALETAGRIAKRYRNALRELAK